MSSEAFVTLATNDGYALGALVLAESLRQVGTQANLVVLISNHLSDLIKETLESCFDEVIIVDELNSNDEEHLALLRRPELGITYTKINCWLLEQYTKCVFLDSDCVVLRNIDDLFQREELSAAPDAGWPDCFNSGVFVYKPSKETFNKLMTFASEQDASFDGGDQGLLNHYFSNWRTEDISRHLPFTYNVTANAFYSYLPAVTRFRHDIHVIHFAGAMKPWQLSYNPQNEQLSGNLTGQSDIQRDFLLSWWRVMYQRVWPKLSKFDSLSNTNNQSFGDKQGFGNQHFGSLNYGNLITHQGMESGSAAHRRAWEAGHIDYFGRDSFSNIQQQLERNISHLPQQYHPSQQRQITPEKTTTTTPAPPSILKNSSKETTPSPPPTIPINQTKSSLKEPTQQSTHQTKSSVKEPTHQPAHPVKSSVKEPTHQPAHPIKSSVKEPAHQPTHQTKSSVNEPAHPIKSSVKEPTHPTKSAVNESTQHKTNVTQSSPKELPLQSTTNLPTSSVKASTTTVQQVPNVTKSSVREATQSTFTKVSAKETTLPAPPAVVPKTTTLLGNTQPLIDSHTHESNWTVKSTIVTAYTQGSGETAGPTVVSKVVSETLASSDSDVPIITSITQKPDPGTPIRHVTSSTTPTATTTNGNRIKH
ncbi:unnamed protein product [Adineta steineri]|uniref:glycogenin glucosyltransferase n=1 Tax=Adineta steineri TaxID=433720 RepID=A0A819BV89_9BILA|nr:unnamed protein product [Adineta steineri]